MFSGKTEELIRRLKRARFANQKVEIFKPRIDKRYSGEEVVSHDQHYTFHTCRFGRKYIVNGQQCRCGCY